MESCTLSKIVMPGAANSRGSLFGGALLAWMDEAAAIVAMRHARHSVVTAHLNSVDFAAPILIGEVAQICARLVGVGRTSMTVEVTAWRENLESGERSLCTTAEFVLVAMGEDRRPVPVPPLTGA
jgi:acyl-CoA hydrolase